MERNEALSEVKALVAEATKKLNLAPAKENTDDIEFDIAVMSQLNSVEALIGREIGIVSLRESEK